MVSSRVVRGHAHELAKQEIVIQLLHEQEIAVDGVTHLEEQGPEQLLRRDGGTTFRGVHGLKVRGELSQGLVHHLRSGLGGWFLGTQIPGTGNEA